MRRIYERATLTLVWLGAEADDSEKAIAFIKMVSRAMQTGGQSELTLWTHNESNWLFLAECWLALVNLISRPWFSRIWVIQEVIAGRNSRVRCGTKEFALIDISLAVTFGFRNEVIPLIHSQLRSSTIGQQMQNMHFSVTHLGYLLLDWELRMKDEGEDTLSALLWKYRNNGATDPRDKIYALLGLLEEIDGYQRERTPSSIGYDPNILLVDYQASKADVYKSLVKSVVSATNKLNIICASEPGGDPTLPSWTPEWSQKWKGMSLIDTIQNPLDKKFTPFAASRDSSASVRFSDDNSIITVKGIIFDTIAAIAPSHGLTANPSDSATFHAFVAAHLRPPDSTSSAAPTTSTQDAHLIATSSYSSPLATIDRTYAIEAHWRALSANADHGGDPPPAEAWSIAFLDWLTHSTPPRTKLALGDFWTRVNLVAKGRRLMYSTAGRVVLGPEKARVGDVLVVIPGCDVPVLVRECGGVERTMVQWREKGEEMRMGMEKVRVSVSVSDGLSL